MPSSPTLRQRLDLAAASSYDWQTTLLEEPADLLGALNVPLTPVQDGFKFGAIAFRQVCHERSGIVYRPRCLNLLRAIGQISIQEPDAPLRKTQSMVSDIPAYLRDVVGIKCHEPMFPFKLGTWEALFRDVFLKRIESASTF